MVSLCSNWIMKISLYLCTFYVLMLWVGINITFRLGKFYDCDTTQIDCIAGNHVDFFELYIYDIMLHLWILFSDYEL